MKKIISFALAFALALCLVGCDTTQVNDNPSTANTPTKNHTQGDTTMEHIWSLTDTNDFVIAMTEHLSEKTQYGDNMSVLSEAERIFYITQSLEMEVNNGGFSQFFYNSSGNFANELVSAFTAIGASTTADICEKAINALGRDIPVDRDERQDMLDEIESDEIEEILAECDDAFFAYEDNLNELNYNFAIKNKEQFS